ncbi:tyrosine-type recombinase/integrase [Nostoc sp. PCC 7107]|uniref:tyrosine-type recombinase/integrase n=1 Tax=Nostoc sp. PCC 7107 TaxID=317936 RepID=UPI00029F1D4D|nr:tyrosine-type recombinase/integrase [Nostoc sp. PCC 7107]AFY43635.1 integrase family protein [Nostoc sp. PCC 7107]
MARNHADQWINTDPETNRLSLRFRVRGFAKQFYLSSGLVDTPVNREIVRLRRDLIKSDIALERFDGSLKSYCFNPIRNGIEACPVSNYPLSLGELWNRFTEFKKALLEPTTIKSNYGATARYIARLPTQDLRQAPQIRDWLLVNTTRRMAWELLVRFNECCVWGVDSGLITQNPFERLKIKKPRKSSEVSEQILAFTIEQRDLVIQGFESHRLHSHYAPLVKFLFYTGVRLGEAFALTWSDVNADCTKISITKSCNLYKVRKGTKNGKRRIFSTVPNSKLHQLLLELKPPAGGAASKTIFISKQGTQMNGDALYNAWYGCPNKDKFYPGVVKELASEGLLPYLKPYSTRHTFATWAIASGITPDRVALLIGDEVSTVLKYYCHPNVVNFECPDF